MSTGLSRRQFLGASVGAGAAVTSSLALTDTTAYGFDLRAAASQVKELKISRTRQTHSVCPYCAVGCGVVIHTLGDNSDNVRSTVVHVEGDPDSPINRGALCPKGITLKRFIVNEDRLTRPLHRLPGSSQWQPLSWEAAYERMSRLIKQSRDAGFEVDDAQGRRVNRWPNVALIGGCTDTNEVNYLLGKLRFALGIVAYENQARL